MFRDLHGAVYIFVNVKAQRIKVGMTINNISSRLRDINDLWAIRKVTCQICGGKRLINTKKLIPLHSVNGIDCLGGNKLPLERDVKVAKSHLVHLKAYLTKLSGSEKTSVTRKIKGMEAKISLYQDYVPPKGFWEWNTVYFTDSAERVELLSHKFLAEHLDRKAPFGEVFSCSVSEGSKAVEASLSQLGLLKTVKKETQNNETLPEYGSCVICGGNLTKRETCPECVKRYMY